MKNSLIVIILFSAWGLFYINKKMHAGEKNNQISQKTVIIMMDGFGESYYRNSDMPTLNRIEKKGIYKIVSSLMPSVTKKR